MKKRTIFLLTFMAIVIALTGTFLIYAIKINNQREEELSYIYQVVGVQAKLHPEDEQALVHAIKNRDETATEFGENVLEKYGYTKENYTFSKSQYTDMISKEVLMTLLLFCFACAPLFSIIIMQQRNQDREYNAIHTVLTAYRNHDFNFSKSTVQDHQKHLIYDTLIVLGKQLAHQYAILDEEKEKTKKLVTDISHQLKTPVAALGTCYDAYAITANEVQKKDLFERIGFQIERLKDHLAALLNISKIESGMVDINPAPTTLEKVLLRSINAMYPKLQRNQIIFERKGADLNIPLYVDEQWTSEAIINVLDNAIKYSDSGTRVIANIIEMTSYVDIQIIDEGIGVSIGESNKMFERFYRGTSDVVQESVGSGIGLFFARNVIEAQLGTVFAQANDDKGSTITIRLQK